MNVNEQNSLIKRHCHINLYAPNISTLKFIKHTLKDGKAHKDCNTVVVRKFITSLIGHELNDTIDQMGLTDIYRIFHPAASQYTFFSAASGTFSKIDHIVVHKASLKNKKTETNPCILSDHNAVKLELNNKSNSRK
jgi:exonuclease III